ncbi:MAG: hypothetical protein ACRDTC_15960 [Pseudonocardiaceae bacterium]
MTTVPFVADTEWLTRAAALATAVVADRELTEPGWKDDPMTEVTQRRCVSTAKKPRPVATNHCRRL